MSGRRLSDFKHRLEPLARTPTRTPIPWDVPTQSSCAVFLFNPVHGGNGVLNKVVYFCFTSLVWAGLSLDLFLDLGASGREEEMFIVDF